MRVSLLFGLSILLVFCPGFVFCVKIYIVVNQCIFREFKKALYTASKDISGHPNFTIDDFMQFAKEAGVKDLEKFRDQATGSIYTATVESARDYAASIGVNGTPGFVIGTQFVSGAQPAEVFHKVIAEELDKVARGEVSAE